MKTFLFFFALAATCLAQQGPGLSARHPGDIGIESDPNVILSDGFEKYTQASQVQKSNGGVWDSGGKSSLLRISTEEHFAGGKSFEIDYPISSTETGFALIKNISPVEPRLYVRAYFRYDPDFYTTAVSTHKGICMSGKYPGPGSPPPRDGSGFFLFLVQNSADAGNYLPGEKMPGFTHVYAYWPYQSSNFGDHWYPTGQGFPWIRNPGQYPDFRPLPNFNVPLGQWFCYELMVKVNDLGRNNGEVKVWVNGSVVADFPDLFIRSVPGLQIDQVDLLDGAKRNPERVNKLWWDNVVIARQYIGPMVSPTTATTPRRAAVIDFNGDGHPDYVLQNAATRQTAIWYLNNNVFVSGASGPTLVAGWALRGLADFNRDSHSDYALFAPSTHRTALWYLSGPTFIGSAYGPTPPSGWELMATADFNGNGYPDYVLYNSATRRTAIWYLSNSVFVSAAWGPTLPAGWSLVGAADFDRNGHTDYLLFNSITRQTAIWYLSGATLLRGAYGPSVPSGWALVATADFNGNGYPDYVLYKASTRQTAIWYLNNNVFVSGAYGPTLPAGWSWVAP